MDKKKTEERPRNFKQLAGLVHRRTVTTQRELAAILNRSTSTVSVHIGCLKEAGVLDSRDFGVSLNRPVRLNPSLAVLAGITVYHRGVRGILTNATYEPFEDAWFDIAMNVSDPHETLGVVAAQLSLLLEESRIDSGATVAVAIGLPTPVNVGTQSLPTPYGLEGWQGLEPGVLLERRLADAHNLSARVFIHNDASLGALGCYHTDVSSGLTSSARSMVRRPQEPLAYVRVSDGIGMGLIINGELYGGAKGYAGEFGHLKVRQSDAYCKRCGRDGCLEAVASTSAVLQQLRDADVIDDRATIHDVLDMGDARARRALRDSGMHVGGALSCVTSLLNPKRIVVGGAPSRSRVFMRSLEKELRAESLPETYVAPITAASALRSDAAGLINHSYPELAGAAVYASHRGLTDTLERLIDAYHRAAPDEALVRS